MRSCLRWSIALGRFKGTLSASNPQREHGGAPVVLVYWTDQETKQFWFYKRPQSCRRRMIAKMIAALLIPVAYFASVESRTAVHILPNQPHHFGLKRSFDQSTGVCVYQGQTYDPDTKMVPDEQCNYLCTCSVSEEFSGFFCQPLCPRLVDSFDCGDGWEKRVERIPAGPPQFRCVCEYHECVESEPFFHVMNWMSRRSVRAASSSTKARKALP